MFDKLSLRAIRTELGYSQKDIAKKLKITPATLSYYESGKRTIGQDCLDKLIKIYGCKYEDIFFKNKSTHSRKSTN